MLESHRQTIERMAERLQADPGLLALIIIGSVARGEADAGSDIDCCVIATDEEYARRQAAHATGLSAGDLGADPGEHVGGSVANLQYLLDVAERGNEPSRFAFTRARIAFSRIPDLDRLLARIPVYPEQERTEKMESFYSQLPVHLSFIELGEYSDNPYLLAQCAVQMVLFGGRLILAHNRILYPNRKLFMREFARAPEKPEGIIEQADALLRRPGIANAYAFCDSIMGFRQWPQPAEGCWERFRRDSELNWWSSRPPVADW